MGVVVAFALAAVRELSVGPLEQPLVSAAHVMATPVRVHHQARRGPLAQQNSLYITGNQYLGHIRPHLRAHDEFGEHILKGV